MGYFSRLLRQTGVRIGNPTSRVRQRVEAASPPALEVEEVRVAGPPRAPAEPSGDERTSESGHGEPEPAATPMSVADSSRPVDAEFPETPKSTKPPPAEPSEGGTPPQKRETASPETTLAVSPPPEPVSAAAPEPEEEALRYVDEAVEWIAAGPSLAEERPAPGPAPGEGLPPATLPARREAAVSPPSRAEPPEALSIAALRPEISNLSVSIGSIELTVEDPTGTSPAPIAARPTVTPEHAQPPGLLRLTRHYLRA
jgi:hypothetical protein